MIRVALPAHLRTLAAVGREVEIGLSMDYEVFLVSRMQEEWVVTHEVRR